MLTFLFDATRVHQYGCHSHSLVNQKKRVGFHVSPLHLTTHPHPGSSLHCTLSEMSMGFHHAPCQYNHPSTMRGRSGSFSTGDLDRLSLDGAPHALISCGPLLGWVPRNCWTEPGVLGPDCLMFMAFYA